MIYLNIIQLIEDSHSISIAIGVAAFRVFLRTESGPDSIVHLEDLLGLVRRFQLFYQNTVAFCRNTAGSAMPTTSKS